MLDKNTGKEINTDIIHGEVIRLTEKAVLFQSEFTEEEIWIPLSLCEEPDTIEVGDTELEIALWFAEKKGLY